uniref:Uncharacterized protein n=1 Tax=Acrobeloides nanus TaxID=290746 RepID=A0A914BWS3_9BILA
MAQAYFHSNAQKSADGGSETVGESSGQENNARWTQTQIDSRNQKSGGSGSEMVNESGGQKNSASRTQTSSDSNDQNLKNGRVQGDSQSNKQEAKYTQYHDTQRGYDASAIGSENFHNQQGYVASVDVSKNDQNRYRYGGLVGSSENVQNQQGYAASVDRSKNDQIQYRYDHSASSSESEKNEYAPIRNLQNQQVDVASVDGSKYDSADGSRYDQNWYRYNNSANGSSYDQNWYRYNASANGSRYDQNWYRYNNSMNSSSYDQNWYRYDASANSLRYDQNRYQYNNSVNGSRYDQNQYRYNTFVDGSRYDQGQYRYADSADGSGNDQTQYRYDASVEGSKYNQNQYRHDSAAVSRYDQNQNNYGSNKDQKQYLYATSANNTKAMYQCNSCPTLLSVVSGSETINQYPGTNQYNCSDITLRCANPNGGGVSFRFYYNGSLAVYDNKCGVDYETVMCSTEGYQWVTINNQYYKVDSVQCSYPNNTCNSTLTTQSPSTNSTLTTQSPATNTKAMYQCNSCPTLLSVVSGSETINQYPGTNQYNCSDITLRCANPSGGGVSFQFYYNGSLAVYDNKCGVDYETVMCSTEGYQWVTINNQYYKVDSVHCSYPNNTCNTTSNMQNPPTTAKDDSTKNENFDGEANSADQKSWKNSKKQKWTNGKNSMDLSNEENRFWAEVNNFENGESDNSINVKTWLRGKNFGWHKNHHKNIIPTDEGHFDKETNDTMVHVELREWYKNHFRDENSTGDDSFEEVRNSNDQRPWLRGDRREKEQDFHNKLNRDRWNGNFEKDDNSTESEYWGRRNKSKTRKFAYLTQNIDSGNVDGQKLSAYENMYKNFVSDKRGEINIPLYYPDGKHLGQLVDTNSSDIGFDKKEYENSTWHQNSTHKNFSWFNSPPEKSINWTVSLSGGIKAKFWLNENNRSSHITGIKKPLVIVTVDHETNNQTNLTQADRLQIYRAWYRESINIINERESGSCQVSKYRDNMFCYPATPLISLLISKTLPSHPSETSYKQKKKKSLK